MKRMITIIAVSLLALFAIGCTTNRAEALVSDIKQEKPDVVDITEENTAVTDFAVRLFQNGFKEDESILISPISVLSSLGIIANGVQGDSRIQIEEVIGLSIEDLNEYMYSYNTHLSDISNRKNKVLSGISFWIKGEEKCTVYDEFLHTNETYYDASIYKTTFDDKCVEEINEWADEAAEGKITEVAGLESVSPEDSMYLINTVTFDGEWQHIYQERGTRNFVSWDGIDQGVITLDSEEYLYMEDDRTVGFIKYYKNKGYAFAALLPKEDCEITEYVQEMTGDQLQGLLSNPKNEMVRTKLPKFSFEYEMDMCDTLRNMGITNVFNADIADFSALGDDSVREYSIDKFLHKTRIDVKEKGTTEADLDSELEGIDEDLEHWVFLDRPFIYIIMDSENQIPLLMGVYMSAE